jgi:hypothetical protein
MGRSWRRIWQRFTRRWANAIWRWSNSPRWSKYRMDRHRELCESSRSGIRCVATRASKNSARKGSREPRQFVSALVTDEAYGLSLFR